MKLEDLNHIRSRIKIKKKPKRCSIRELYIYQFSVYLPVWKIDDDRRIASRKGARNSMKTDVEQTSNNYESIGSPTKSTPHEFPPGWTIKSERVCPTYTSKRTEKRRINNVFDSPTLLSARPSISLSSLPFFYSFSKRTRARFLDTNEEESMLLHVA